MNRYKDHLAKLIEWLLKLAAPTLLATLLAWESQLSQWLDTAPSIWRFRLLAGLLSLSLGLLAWLYLSRPKYIEYRGAYFKRKDDGSYHETVYCGICKKPTATGDFHTASIFKCICGWQSEIRKGELPYVIKELP